MSGWHLGVRMMRLCWWGLAGVFIGHVALTIYLESVIRGAESDSVMEQVRMLSLVLGAADVTFAGGLAYGALKLRSGDGHRWGLAFATGLAFTVGACLSAATLAVQVLPSLAAALDPADWTMLQHARLAIAIAGFTFFVAFVARTLGRAGMKLPLPLVFGIGALYAAECLLQLEVITLPPETAAIWLVRVIDVAPAALSALLAGTTLSRLRRAASTPSLSSPYRAAANADGDAAGNRGPAWVAAADGLGLYASALATRIGAMVAGAALMFLAGQSRSADAGRAVAVLVGSTTALTSVAMMIGVHRYKKAPDEDAVGQGATAALLLMIAAFAVEIYGLKLLFDVIGGRFAVVVHAAELLPTVQLAAQGIGVFALLLLIGSFSRVARALDAIALVSRARTVTVLLVAVVAMAICVRVVVGAANALRDAPAIFIGSAAILVGLALTAVVRYVSLVFALRNAMRARAG